MEQQEGSVICHPLPRKMAPQERGGREALLVWRHSRYSGSYGGTPWGGDTAEGCSTPGTLKYKSEIYNMRSQDNRLRIVDKI